MLAQRTYETQKLIDPRLLSTKPGDDSQGKNPCKDSAIDKAACSTPTPPPSDPPEGDPPKKPDPSAAVAKAQMITQEDSNLHPRFVNACYRGNLNHVNNLLDNHKITKEMLNAGLHVILSFPSSTRLMETLLKKGANVNALSGDTGESALHRIASNICGIIEASNEKCELLFRYGADPNVKNRSNETPLESLISNKHSYHWIHNLLKHTLKHGVKIPENFDFNAVGHNEQYPQSIMSLEGQSISGVKFYPGNNLHLKDCSGATFIACDFSALDKDTLIENKKNFEGAKIFQHTNKFPEGIDPVKDLGMEEVEFEIKNFNFTGLNINPLSEAPYISLFKSTGFPRSIEGLGDREYESLKRIIKADPNIRNNSAELSAAFSKARSTAFQN